MFVWTIKEGEIQTASASVDGIQLDTYIHKRESGYEVEVILLEDTTVSPTRFTDTFIEAMEAAEEMGNEIVESLS